MEDAMTTQAANDIGSLLGLLAQEAGIKPMWLSASDLHRRLIALANQHRIPLDSWANKAPQALSRAIAKNAEAFWERFGLQIDVDRHTKCRIYHVDPTAGRWRTAIR